MTLSSVNLFIEILEETGESALGVVRAPVRQFINPKGDAEVLLEEVRRRSHPFPGLEELERPPPEFLIDGDLEKAGSKAFDRLFRYISGDNQSRNKVAMTAPVSQERAREKIKMTAPVSMQPAGEGEKIGMTAPVTMTPKAGDASRGTYVFSFVMPSRYTRANLPQPVDPRVRIREAPARLVAARRYSGTWSEPRYREQESILLEAVAHAGLPTTGKPVFARYNAPFTLWFLRRNEVLIEVAAAP